MTAEVVARLTINLASRSVEGAFAADSVTGRQSQSPGGWKRPIGRLAGLESKPLVGQTHVGWKEDEPGQVFCAKQAKRRLDSGLTALSGAH